MIMARKKMTLAELKAQRVKLDHDIKMAEQAELQAVAEWVLKITKCHSLDELKATGWTLTRRPADEPLQEVKSTADDDPATVAKAKAAADGAQLQTATFGTSDDVPVW